MILHIDMDAFYAAVELRDNPSLQGKPVVVGGSPKGRGVIAAASYEARKYGLRSAMPASKAIRLCPKAVFIKPRMQHYAEISKQIRDIFYNYTSLVEPISLDEAFLDVSGSTKLFGSAETIAREIKQRISGELGLVASAGVAPNKFLAKVASDLEKPDGLVIVDPEQVHKFLDPLPITRVWGVGKQTEKKFNALGVRTVFELRRLSMDLLKRTFGVNCEHFWRLSRGLDTRPVISDRDAKTISHETTFSHDIHDIESLRAWLLELTDQVARRMRRHEVYGKTVQLKIRYGNFDTITRRFTLATPTNVTREISDQATELLSRIEDVELRGVRLLGIGVANLSNDAKIQKSLFDEGASEKSRSLDSTTDKIKDKFGGSAVRRATSIEHQVRHRPDPRVRDK